MKNRNFIKGIDDKSFGVYHQTHSGYIETIAIYTGKVDPEEVMKVVRGEQNNEQQKALL